MPAILPKATGELGKFHGFWAKVEDGVRTKTSAAYGAICPRQHCVNESNVKIAQTTLKSADKSKKYIIDRYQQPRKQIIHNLLAGSIGHGRGIWIKHGYGLGHRIHNPYS